MPPPFMKFSSIYQEDLRRKTQKTSIERSKLCHDFFIPSYVSSRLGRRGRSSLRKVILPSLLTASGLAAIHLYMENAVELVVLPTRSGLKIKAIYHSHPWVAPKGTTKNEFMSECIPWRSVLDPELSAHQKIDWISKLPQDSDSESLQVLRADIARLDCVQVSIGLLQLDISRPSGLGLEVKAMNSLNKKTTNLLVDITSQQISSTICAFAQDADHRFNELPTIQQVLLQGALEFGPILDLVEDAFTRGALKLKRNLKNRKTSTT